MKEKKLSLKNKKIHFIGICGASMSGLAMHLKNKGFCVTGSDLNPSGVKNLLEKQNITVFDKHEELNVSDCDAVIYSSAISQDNIELKFAKNKKIPIFSRSQLLGEIISEYKKSIAVGGSHGKTTTTAMIASILVLANKTPTVFLGGESLDFSNYIFGKGHFAVTEACEYKKNILDLSPYIAVVLNVDNDHLDCYKDMGELVETFKKFASGRLTFINADDKYAKEISNQSTVTFGVENIANYMAKDIKRNFVGYSFSVYAYSIKLGKINLPLMGKHNIYNALASIAVCDSLKIPFWQIKKALENFKGVKRRCEYLGKFSNCDCFADYAHHPEEIKATLCAFNEQNQPFAVVFQPHTYSRTKILMDEFVRVLKDLNDLIIYQTYSARESFDEDGSAKKLYDNLQESSKTEKCFVCTSEQLRQRLLITTKKYKRILFLGAGDIYDIAKEIINQQKS